MPAFGNVVVDLPLVLPPAEFAGDFGGEVIGQGEKDLGAEGLKQSAPAFAGQGRAQRADALGGDDGDALGLTGQGEELLVAARVVFADGGKVLILVADEEDLSEVLLGVGLDLWDAVQDGALEVELHHDADGFGQSWVEGYREVQSADFAGLNEISERRQRPTVLALSVECGVVALFRRAESPLD